MVWAEVSCTVPATMVDEVAEFLVDLSGSGVSIDNLFLDTFSLDTVEESDRKTVKAYLPADADLSSKVDAITAFLAKHGPAFPGFTFLQPTISLLREEDWANNWKQYFKPARIGKRLVIKPTWETFSPDPDDLIIELDPGMAFGTGTHATTRLCLEALEQLFFREGAWADGHGPVPATVLDVGTGSGILAIAAAKLGGARIVGLDIDPRAIEVARENVRQNGEGENVELDTTPLTEVKGQFDVVLANILAEELVRLASPLIDHLVQGGTLVLSGILTEREEFVRAGFAGHGVTLLTTTRHDEWSCLCYRRDA
ncbi:50S ribosomal protein L11 methyltransferase [Geobacter sp. AOG1]|uniref:50S ribosomal protein L11 methyltransferase n=1 Tax=Geobacter sp. AOG1 TaxID=1566346 RepID=UPI001CC728F4|nr:50S ribosomal protein L11 methyltransferase [Geobacter sp. AOG1]